jgi:hypothetical protein
VSNYADKNTQAQIFKTEANKTRNFIFAIAILYFVGGLIPVAMAVPSPVTFIVAVLLFPAIFAGVGFVAPKQTFDSNYHCRNSSWNYSYFTCNFCVASWLGWVYFLIAGGCIAGGFMSANKAEAAKKLMH